MTLLIVDVLGGRKSYTVRRRERNSLPTPQFGTLKGVSWAHLIQHVFSIINFHPFSDLGAYTNP